MTTDQPARETCGFWYSDAGECRISPLSLEVGSPCEDCPHARPAEAPDWQPGDRVEVYLMDKSVRRGGGHPRRWFSGTVRAVNLPGLPPGVKVDLDREVNGARDCYATRAELRPTAEYDYPKTNSGPLCGANESGYLDSTNVFCPFAGQQCTAGCPTNRERSCITGDEG